MSEWIECNSYSVDAKANDLGIKSEVTKERFSFRASEVESFCEEENMDEPCSYIWFKSGQSCTIDIDYDLLKSLLF